MMIDIVFQSGEFFTDSNSFWNSLISLVGVFITGGFAIYLFNKGQEKERNLNRELRKERISDKKKEEKQELEAFKNYIVSLIEGSIADSLKQIKQYKEYADKLNEEPKKQHMLELKTISSLKRLNSINHNQLFNLFRRYSLDINTFNNFIRISDYLKDVFEEIFNSVIIGNGKDVTIMSNKVLNLRSEIIEVISVYNDNLRSTDPNYKNNFFWKSLNGILELYIKDNNGYPNLYWDEEHLINPLKTMLIKDEYLKLEIRNELLSKCKIAGDTMYSIVDFNQFSANQIFINHKDITKSCEELEEIKKLLLKSQIML